MITAATIDELPDRIPPLVREGLSISALLDAEIFADRQWSRMPMGILMRFKVVAGSLSVSVAELGQSGVTQPLVAGLRYMIRERVPPPRPGEHVGTAAMSEGYVGSEAATDLPPSGQDLEETIEDLVAQGALRQIRSTLAVFSSGWRYEYRRERTGNKIAIEVYEPGEEWTSQEVKLLTVLDAKLQTRP